MFHRIPLAGGAREWVPSPPSLAASPRQLQRLSNASRVCRLGVRLAPSYATHAHASRALLSGRRLGCGPLWCLAALPEMGLLAGTGLAAVTVAGPAAFVAISAGLAAAAAALICSAGGMLRQAERQLSADHPVREHHYQADTEHAEACSPTAPPAFAQSSMPADAAAQSSPSQEAPVQSPVTASAGDAAALQAQQVWTAAWQSFEEARADTPSGSSPTEGRPPTQGASREEPASSGSGALSGTGQASGAVGSLAPGSSDARAIKRAQYALQGLEAGARFQLLALSLCALEQHVAALPNSAAEATANDWRALMGALLASCSVAAARAWLGYAPADLQAQAAALVTSCQPEITEEAETAATAQLTAEPSLWRTAAEKALLHATVLRFLRYGPRTTKGFRRRPADLEHSLGTADEGEGSAILAGAGDSGQSGADSGTLGGGGGGGGGGQLGMQPRSGTAARRRAAAQLARQPSGIRGWRQRELAAAAQDSLLPHAPTVLQDMATAIAEAVATAYLAEVRVGVAGAPSARDPSGSALLGSSAWPTFVHPRLSSTRALERFRNQVAFEQWARHSYWAVAAMYEDRHELVGLAPGGALLRVSLPAKRTKELEALTGWRSLVSLALELGDVAVPLLQSAFARLGAAVSWLLVILIGRSLGLVFRGVRESLAGGKGAERQGPSGRGPLQRPSWWPSMC